MSIGDFKLIPHFISASNPEGLQREMLRVNVKTGRQNNYFSIVKDGSRWVAWYLSEAKVRYKRTGKKVDIEITVGE